MHICAIYTFVRIHHIHIHTYIHIYVCIYIYVFICTCQRTKKSFYLGMCFTVNFALSSGFVIKIEAPANPLNQVWLKSTARLDLKRKDYIKRTVSQSGAAGKFGV